MREEIQAHGTKSISLVYQLSLSQPTLKMISYFSAFLPLIEVPEAVSTRRGAGAFLAQSCTPLFNIV